jgi:uncharacterized iron-regulated membrane protein
MRLRLSRHAFVTFWDVHAWCGMLAALVLHFTFFFGALTLLQTELRIWEEPALQRVPLELGPADVPGLIASHVPAQASAEEISVYIGSPPSLSYTPRGASAPVRLRLDPATHAAAPQRAYVAQAFDDLHSLSIEQAPWLERVAGLLCVALGLALVTGVLIHLKDLLRQLFQLRLDKGMKIFWSDAHKILGVWGLPFLVLFAWTGALLNLEDWMKSAVQHSQFAGDDAETAQALARAPPRLERGALSARALPFADSIERARRAAPDFQPDFFRFRALGYAGATLEAWGPQAGAFEGLVHVRLSASSGAVLSVQHAGAGETAWAKARRWLFGLHFANFGGPGALGVVVRSLYAAAALGACLAFLSGNWIWLARRDPARKRVGNRILARLTVGFGAGLCVASSWTLLAGRLLPLETQQRSTHDALFWGGWLAALIAAGLPRRELSAWWQQLAMAAALFALCPFATLRHSDAGLLGRLLPGSHPASGAALGVDLLLSGLALTCAWLALRIRRSQRHELELGASSPETLGRGVTR